MGVWEVKLEIMTDRPTDRQTNRQAGMRAHREVSLPIVKNIFGNRSTDLHKQCSYKKLIIDN